VSGLRVSGVCSTSLAPQCRSSGTMARRVRGHDSRDPTEIDLTSRDNHDTSGVNDERTVAPKLLPLGERGWRAEKAEE
jgi:hypothetical protein